MKFSRQFSIAFCAVLCLLAIAISGQTRAEEKEFAGSAQVTASSHASTLVELRRGGWLCAWFGGTAEGKEDVAIWSARRLPDGTWTKPVVLVREPGVATWNPVLFYAKSGRLWLYYKFGPSYTWWTAGRRWSMDDGKTWSPVEHLPAGIYGPIRTKPLLQQDGTLVSGTSVESYSSWSAWVERSSDGGFSWRRYGPIEIDRSVAQQPYKNLSVDGIPAAKLPFGIIQPTVVQLRQRHLRMYARSSWQVRRICVSDSYDDGIMWTPAHALDLPNPNSGIDAVRLRDGRVVLIFDDSTTARTPLVLAVSRDGEHFRKFLTLEEGAGEFSYPAIVQGKNGDLYMTYTWNRKRIRFVHVPLTQVPRGPQATHSAAARDFFENANRP